MALQLVLGLACVALWRRRPRRRGKPAWRGEADCRSAMRPHSVAPGLRKPGPPRRTQALSAPLTAPPDRRSGNGRCLRTVSRSAAADEGRRGVSAGRQEAGDNTPTQRSEGSDRSGSPAAAASRAGGATPAASGSASASGGGQARGRAEAAAPGRRRPRTGRSGTALAACSEARWSERLVPPAHPPRARLRPRECGVPATWRKPRSRTTTCRRADRAYVRDYYRAIGRLNEP